jgi:TolB-like protein/Flp pilus assembly protein TadD
VPIVAVLPFENQTGDQTQGYLADGLTDQVINALGRFNSLRVVGRNSVLRFRNRSPTQDEITGDLGANYLVSGTVSRSGKRVRIAAQLTDPKSGTLMWTDRYDGELVEVFDFQDVMARQIAGTLAANISSVESRRSLSQPKPDANAFDLTLRARAVGHASTRTANRRFRELIAEALELDSGYAAAHALMAEALHSQAILGWSDSPDRELSRGAEEARKAVTLAPDQPDGYRALGRILLARGEHDQAQDALKRAVELNPSDASALASWGAARMLSGDIAAGIDSLQLSLRLDAMLEPNYVFDLAIAYFLAHRYDDALRTAERGLARYPNFAVLNAPAAAASAQLGRSEQAATYIAELHRRLPMLDVDALGSRFRLAPDRDRLRAGLKAAGL